MAAASNTGKRILKLIGSSINKGNSLIVSLLENKFHYAMVFLVGINPVFTRHPSALNMSYHAPVLHTQRKWLKHQTD
jgi:hypothetical protein